VEQKEEEEEERNEAEEALAAFGLPMSFGGSKKK